MVLIVLCLGFYFFVLSPPYVCYHIKVGFKGVYMTRTCIRDVIHASVKDRKHFIQVKRVSSCFAFFDVTDLCVFCGLASKAVLMGTLPPF